MLATSSSVSVQGDFENQAEFPVWGMASIGTTAGVVKNALSTEISLFVKQNLKALK